MGFAFAVRLGLRLESVDLDGLHLDSKALHSDGTGFRVVVGKMRFLQQAGSAPLEISYRGLELVGCALGSLCFRYKPLLVSDPVPLIPPAPTSWC